MTISKQPKLRKVRSVRLESGFTLVEVLIVIVIIAILAAITVVAYRSIVVRANDARRMQDAAAIRRTLSLYKVDNGNFPVQVPNPGNSSFELSTDPGFLGSLNGYDNGAVFKDPINKSATSAYWYHYFSAGSYGCPASMGNYYVFWIYGMQNQTSPTIVTNGCDTQTLFTVANWNPQSSYYVYFGFN